MEERSGVEVRASEKDTDMSSVDRRISVLVCLEDSFPSSQPLPEKLRCLPVTVTGEVLGQGLYVGTKSSRPITLDPVFRIPRGKETFVDMRFL